MDDHSIHDDIVSGFQCSHCGVCFEDEHGYPVLCESCFKEDGGVSGLPNALEKEM